MWLDILDIRNELLLGYVDLHDRLHSFDMCISVLVIVVIRCDGDHIKWHLKLFLQASSPNVSWLTLLHLYHLDLIFQILDGLFDHVPLSWLLAKLQRVLIFFQGLLQDL